jgi:hypothetical protein
VLTANPTGLAPGQYFADVSVISTDPLVVNNPPERVRVGFAVRAADAPPQVDLPGVLAPMTAANPVEPEVFVIAGTAVSVYDIYSGTLLRTLPATAGTPQALAMSADGQSLYVAENLPSSARIDEVDPVSGAFRRMFSLDRQIGLGFAMAHARPDGHALLLTTYDTFDVATGPSFPDSVVDGATSIAVSSNQRYVYIQNGGQSDRMIERYELRYSSFNRLRARLLATNTGNEVNYARANVGDIALSADDAVLHLANGYPYWFDRLAADTLLLLAPPLAGAPYPDNVETCWNGLVAAGADASQEPLGDIWIYDATGAERARLNSGNDALFRQSVRFSGDCTRLVSASASLRFHAVP